MTEVAEHTDLLAAGPAHGLAGLLDVAAPDFAAGEPLPLLWHWVYLLDHPATADIGTDGHPARGGVPIPPGAGPRRMFAGGRVRTHGHLLGGRPATRREFVTSVSEKTGRSGRLTFVTVAHEILQDGTLVVSEERDLVYRDAASPTAAPALGAEVPETVPPTEAERVVPIDPVFLFRFSALTYNGHRIHYDRDYARDVEGYPGLLVHGPLQAVVMADTARRLGLDTGPGSLFEYRLLAPLFDRQGMVAFGGDNPDEVGVRDLAGRTTATGRVSRL